MGIKLCCFLKITYILDKILEKRMQKVEMILETTHTVTTSSGVILEINYHFFSPLY